MLAFRLTDRDIEVGRVSDDDAEDQQLLGHIQKLRGGGYTLTGELRESCGSEDLDTLERWLTRLTELDRETQEIEDSLMALRLPQKLAEAERWLAETDHPEAGYIALRIAAAMQTLEAFLEAEAPPAFEPMPEQGESEPAVRGHLDKVTPRFIAGWAIQADIEQPCQIQLRINDHRELKVTADQHRPDLLKHGQHPTGDCGFRVELSPEDALTPGDQVRAYHHPSGAELKNSPTYCA